jgi:23S rRNA (cytosine1962-C5)-methyltransferase
MNDSRKVILKPSREKALRNRHPWIFSGAIDSFPVFENGEILPVYGSTGEFLAKAYFHTENSICGRILTFIDEPVENAIEQRMSQAIALRKKMFDREKTNCFRLINAEGDGLPGLIIDLYDDLAVIQINTYGIQRLKPLIVEKLKAKLKLRGIYEKSHSAARRQEGLPDSLGALHGECPKEILVKENDVLFLIAIEEGQKTGFFLDQREMRQLIYRLSRNKRVLNCFSYTGGFSLFALKGGAKSVTSVDSSESACRYAMENTLLNHISLSQHEVVKSDVVDYLKNSKQLFDIVILDPPAFAKKRQDVDGACRGYKEINRRVLEMMPPDSYLLTCSCSHFIDDTLFQQVVFQSAIEARREASICSRHIQAADHPISLFHPEGGYLKSLLLHIHSPVS